MDATEKPERHAIRSEIYLVSTVFTTDKSMQQDAIKSAINPARLLFLNARRDHIHRLT
jgi:hypothetical protein